MNIIINERSPKNTAFLSQNYYFYMKTFRQVQYKKIKSNYK